MPSRYRGCKSRKEKSKILDELVELSGYSRHYAAWLLRNFSKRRVVSHPTGEVVEKEVVFCWEFFDQMCGKRLVEMIPDILPSLVKHRLSEDKEVYEKLQSISAATVDRMLKEQRAKRRLKGNTRARPYHSNDTCYVEQKNYNIVRQAVGYHRYETEEEVTPI